MKNTLAPSFVDAVLTTSVQLTSTDMTSHTSSPVFTDSLSGAVNDSMPEGCIKVRFSEMQQLQRNDSDTIVSTEARVYVAQIRTNMLLILFLIGGPANVINMAVFFKQGLKDRVNLLLFSLSLADELYLVMAMLHYVEGFYFQITGEAKLGPLFIFLVNNHLSGLQGFGFISFVLSAIIACERCYCVLRPLKYQTLMRTRTLAVIIMAVQVIVLSLYFIAVFRYYIVCVYDLDSAAVTNVYSHSEFYRRHKDLVNYLDSIVFGTGFPTVIVLVVVTATIITMLKLGQAMAWRSETSSSASPKEVALTKMLIGSSVLLVVCVSPACLFRVAGLFLPEMNTGGRYENLYLTCLRISLILTYINSSVNIFIYYVMGSRYRETFWALLKTVTGRKINKA